MKTKKQNKKGIAFATGVAFLQGFEGLIFNLFVLGGFGMLILATPEFSAATLAVKETFTLLITMIIIGPKIVKSVINKMRSKQGVYFILAGSIGTAFGNFFYILGIGLAGSGYGVILTAFYPIFSMLLIKFYNKEKEPKLVWVGVAMSVMSGLLFVTIPVIISGDNFNINQILGMLMGLFAAFFWAIEGFFIKKGMDYKCKEEFTTAEIILSRSLSSFVATMILIMPVTMLFGNSFNYFGKILSDWRTILVALLMVTNLIILRFIHIHAISLIGPKLTAIIDSNNFLVPAIFIEFLQFIPGIVGDSYEKGLVEWWAFLLMIPIAVGVFMVIYFRSRVKINMKILKE